MSSKSKEYAKIKRYYKKLLGDKVFHLHHIIPMYAGGEDTFDNLIPLSPEEHYEIHKKQFEETGHPAEAAAMSRLAKLIGDEHPSGYKLNLTEEQRALRSECAKSRWEDPLYREQTIQSMVVAQNRDSVREHKSKMLRGKKKPEGFGDKLREAKRGSGTLYRLTSIIDNTVFEGFDYELRELGFKGFNEASNPNHSMKYANRLGVKYVVERLTQTNKEKQC